MIYGSPTRKKCQTFHLYNHAYLLILVSNIFFQLEYMEQQMELILNAVTSTCRYAVDVSIVEKSLV